MGRKKKKPEVRHINQQAVHINKELSHRKEYYFTLDITRSNQAMRNLSGSAYKMYIYLCQNRNNTSVLISSSKFCETTGLSPRSYVLAKQELLKNRYLRLREDGDYDFYNYQYRQHHETVYEKMGVPDPKTIAETDSQHT